MVNMCHRVDHFLSNINTLYKLNSNNGYFNKDIYLLGRNSLTWLLQPGTHRIHVPQSLRLCPEENYVGFFPLGSVCNECTTTGLKWNLCKFCYFCFPLPPLDISCNRVCSIVHVAPIIYCFITALSC